MQAVGVLILVLGIGSIIGGIRLSRELKDKLNRCTHKAKAVLTDIELIVEDNVDGRQRYGRHHYEYEVNGEIIKSSEEEKRMFNTGHKGGKYTVWYNPEKPCQIISERGIGRNKSRIRGCYIQGVLFIIFGFLVALFAR